MTAVTAEMIEQVRRRRDAGEPLTALAREVGLNWQRLWSILKAPAAAPSARPVWRADGPDLVISGTGSLTDRCRPRTLSALWGQENAVRVLRRFAADPYSAAFLLEGATGAGDGSAGNDAKSMPSARDDKSQGKA
jgi:hypothetical protein